MKTYYITRLLTMSANAQARELFRGSLHCLITALPFFVSLRAYPAKINDNISHYSFSRNSNLFTILLQRTLPLLVSFSLRLYRAKNNEIIYYSLPHYVW